LYSSISYVSAVKCSNNQGQTVNYPNGFCQLTCKGISNDDCICIPEDKGGNPSGIVIASNSVEEPDAEATL